MPRKPGGQNSLGVRSMLDVRAGPGQPAGDVPRLCVFVHQTVEQEVDQTAVSRGRNLSARCKNTSVTLTQDVPVTGPAVGGFVRDLL